MTLPRPTIRFGRRILPAGPVASRSPVPPPDAGGIRPGDTVRAAGVGLPGGTGRVERIERRGSAVVAVLDSGRAVPVGRCRRVG